MLNQLYLQIGGNDKDPPLPRQDTPPGIVLTLSQMTTNKILTTNQHKPTLSQLINQSDLPQTLPVLNTLSTSSSRSMDTPISNSSTTASPQASYFNQSQYKRLYRKKKAAQVDINIISNNINGLQVNSLSNRLEIIVKHMNTTNVDIVLLQEVNANLEHRKFKAILSTIQRINPNMQFIFSNMKSNQESAYLPGGTAIIVKHTIAKHIHQRIIDHMGRWSGIILKIKSHSILLLSVYQPPKQPCSNGTVNVTAQQTRWLVDNGITTSVHTTLRKDLLTLILEYQRSGHLILIAGDFNEHVTQEKVLQDLTQIAKLVDVFVLQGIRTNTSTRGPHMLDRLFLSPNLIPNLSANNIEDLDYLITSDHRPISLSLTFNTSMTDTNEFRQLTSNHMNKVTQYVNKVHAQMIKQNLFQQIQELTEIKCTEEKLNEIDQSFLKIRLQAEAKMKQQYNDWWHKDLKLWKSTLKQYNRELNLLRKQSPKPHDAIISILSDRKVIIQKFRDHTSHGYQIRHKYLQQEIQDLKTTSKNKNKLNHLKSILRTEKTRELYKKISRKTKPYHKMQQILQVQQQDSSVKEVTDTEEMAKCIIDFNKTHFAQAGITPLSTYQLQCDTSSASKLDSYHSSDPCQSNSSAPVMDSLQSKQHFLQQFLHNINQEPTTINNFEIEQEEWIHHMKRWKERTTTSPSGLHLGHHKALHAPHNYTYEENGKQKQEMDYKQNSILTAFLQVLNLALLNTIALSRWKTVHSIVLFKDATNKYLHRIRNIHIYEADYNLLLKQKWGEAVAHAEENTLLHSCQFGSRKDRRSLDPIFTEIMMQEFSRLTTTSFLQVNYDAQACYDRIIPDIAFQISRKHGIHKKVIEMVRQVLHQTKYYIKIGNKITEQFYSNTPDIKLFGTGQGSGFSPHIWTLLSSELFQLYSEYSQGFCYHLPYTDESSQVHITAYVDDVNTHHTFPQSTTYNQMIQQTAISAQRWHDILYISGGQLSNTKCNYYAVKWDFATTGRAKINSNQLTSMTIQDPTGQPFNIYNIPTSESHKSLGYQQSMASTKIYQKKKIQEIIQQMSQVLTLLDLDYTQIRVYYHTIFAPKIQYATQLTSVTQPNLRNIIKTCNIQTLQKMGYSSATPKGVYKGHKNFAGLELIDLYMYQGAQNVVQLIRSLQPQNPNVRLVQASYLWWVYQDGRSQCPLQYPNAMDSITDSIWFPEMKVFLREYQLSLKVNIPFPPLQRQKDQYLMDLVYTHDYPKKIISNINQCRLFLQVLTISDITTVDGKYIDLTCYEHKSATRRNQRSFHQPRKKPNKSIWHYWTTWVNTLTYANSRRLRYPLGEWIVPYQDIRTQSAMYRDQDSTYLLKKHHILQTNINSKQSKEIAVMPPYVIPCKQAFQQIFPSAYQSTFQNQIIKVTESQVLHANFPEEIYIYTDASVKNNISAIAWVVTSTTGTVLHQKNQCLTEGNISSFRAEAIGICAALRHLTDQITKNNTRWTLLCDNKSVIFRLNSIQKRQYNTEWMDFDVFQNIIAVLPENGTFQHIKGHQTITKTSSHHVKMNTYVDTLANDATLQSPQEFDLQNSITLKSGTRLLYNVSSIIQFCQTQVSITMWKSRLGNEIYDTIYWEIYNKLCRCFRDQVSIIKLFNELTPTRQRLHKLNQSHTELCPLCQTKTEDFHHVAFCSHNPERLQLHTHQIERRLERYGDIHSFCRSVFQNLENPSADLQMTAQSIIGWKEILRGKISLHLAESIIPKMKKIKTHILFIVKLCKSIITQWKKAWLYRLKQTGKEDSNVTTEQQHNNQTAKLQFLYTNQHLLREENRQFMCDNLDIHLRQSHAQISAWLDLHYVSMKQEVRSYELTISDIKKEDLDQIDPMLA